MVCVPSVVMNSSLYECVILGTLADIARVAPVRSNEEDVSTTTITVLLEAQRLLA